MRAFEPQLSIGTVCIDALVPVWVVLDDRRMSRTCMQIDTCAPVRTSTLSPLGGLMTKQTIRQSVVSSRMFD